MLWYPDVVTTTSIMPEHPEMNEGPIGDLMKAISDSETCEVWCVGCNAFRKMNAKYARIIGTGEIMSCTQCPKK